MSVAVLVSSDLTNAGGALVTDTFSTVTGTTYTVQSTDAGKILRFTSATAVTVTLPALTAGFNCLWRQVGAGKISFVVAVTDPVQTLRNTDAFSKSSGQYAEGSLSVDLVTTDWYLSGSCGA
jgi:hypothetical protein